jgi:hypothetical protein
MRTALLLISGTTGLFFAVSFALTFFARDYIHRLAQDYVIEKTHKHSDPIVNAAEQAVNVPAIKLILNDEELDVVRAEIAKYREDPRAYIVKLVVGDGRKVVAADKKAPLKERVLQWKQQIREYFDNTLDRLLRDLRIFFGSNLVAATLAFVLAWRGRPERLRILMVASCLLLICMGFGIYMYIDSLSYFRILMGSYMGWWYPVFVGLMFLGMMIGSRKPP